MEHPPVIEETHFAVQKEVEMPVQQEPVVIKDDEEPMEQGESEPVILEETGESISQVSPKNSLNKIA